MKGGRGGGSVAVLSVARPKVNFMCGASGSRCYFINVPYLSFSLCLSRQFCHRETGKKRCWKKYTRAFFLQLIRSNRFFFSEKAAQSKMFWGRFKRIQSPTKSFPKLVLLGAKKYARPPHLNRFSAHWASQKNTTWGVYLEPMCPFQHLFFFQLFSSRVCFGAFHSGVTVSAC